MFTMGRAKHDAMASTDDESVKTLNVESDNYKKNQIMNKDAYALEICEKPPTEESSDEEVNGGQITPHTMRRPILSPCSISREKSATCDNSPRCNVTTCNDQKSSHTCRLERPSLKTVIRIQWVSPVFCPITDKMTSWKP